MTASVPPRTLGTAGHIDHGKTALIGALTGTNTDRLPEERRRGLTIELGFAELRLPDNRRLSVVDVPGHERFVRTMVAGSTGINLYLLCVAADDGVMPQTREHWAVLRALGVARGVVAITKRDLADRERVARTRREVRELMVDAPVIEVSARTGAGLEELRGAITSVAQAIDREAADDEWPQVGTLLHVDRVFTLHGIGTVVTGTLWSGSVARGDRVELLPSVRAARVRSVHVHDRERDRADAGQRVALNLAGIRRSEIRRGDIVARPGSGLRPTYRLDVALRLEPWVAGVAGQRVQAHHGTRAVSARVVALDEDEVLAQLRLSSPLIARTGDRMVLRRIAPPDTLGGAEVIDPSPARHGGGPSTDRLRLIAEGGPTDLLERALREDPLGIADDPSGWAASALLGPALDRFPRETWEEAASGLVSNGRARLERGRLLSGPRPTAHAGQESLPARPTIGPDAERALGLLRQDGVEPRSPQAVADTLGLERDEAVAALEELVRAGEALRVRPGVYYEAGELARGLDQALGIVHARRSITIAELRDALGTSRKYAQALLEHLDARRETERVGDRHVPRSGRSPGSGSGGATLAAGRQESGGSPGLQSQ